MGGRQEEVRGNPERERTKQRNRALLELAKICKEGSESEWPSRHHFANADAWQSAYEKLAIRIADGRVDIGRPLRPLARLTAHRILLSEHRRQRRFSALSDLQLHRFNLGETIQPEELAEASRRRRTLRTSIAKLQKEGKMSITDVTILKERYVQERSSDEVARTVGTTGQNVRQISGRRRRLLRAELAELELEEPAS